MSLAPTSKKTPPTHHKKRSGEHHRHSKHYLKTYYPYLPLLLIVLVGLAINVFWTSKGQVLGATSSMTASQLLTDTNHDRATAGQDNLKLSTALNAAAQSKANDMVAKNYWSHTTPDGRAPWYFIKQSGYTYYTAGENLAYGFPNAESAIDGWMNSNEHRANMLSADFTEVGFGIAPSTNFLGHGKTTVIVAMYAEPSVMGNTSNMSSASISPSQDIPLKNVARIQLLTHGQAPWSLTLLTLIAVSAATWFIYRHIKAWKRVLQESEEFFVHHRYLDILIVATAVAGFLLTRSAGFIN